MKVDESALKDIPGAKAVWDKGFLAVVADKEWDAIKASQALKVEWSNVTPPFPDEKALYDYIRKAPVRNAKLTARAPAMSTRPSTSATRVIEAEYEWPYPVACLHGPGLRRGRDQGRSRHGVDRLAEAALRAGWRCQQPGNTEGQGPRHLG